MNRRWWFFAAGVLVLLVFLRLLAERERPNPSSADPGSTAREAGEPPAAADPSRATEPDDPLLPAPGPGGIGDTRSADTVLTGLVVLDGGRPATGVTVTIHENDYEHGDLGPPSRKERNRTWAAVTGEDGSFRFSRRDVPYLVCGQIALRAVSEGLASEFVDVNLNAPSPDDLVLTLVPSIRLRGEVVGESGEHIAGAKIGLFVQLPPTETRMLPQAQMLRARSDDSGQFRLPPIPRREDWIAKLKVTHPTVEDLELAVATEVLLSGTVLRAVLSTGLTVRGRLVHPDGKPAAGIFIRTGSREHGWPQLTDEPVGKTDARGAFQLPGVPVDGAIVAFYRDPKGYPWFLEDLQKRRGSPVELGDVQFPASGEIRGVLLDEKGQPIADHGLMAGRPWYDTSHSGYSAVTDGEGRFVVTGLPPGEYTLRAEVEIAEDDELPAVLHGVVPGTLDAVLRTSRAATLLLVFHLAERPDDAFQLPSPSIHVDGHLWSAGGSGRCRRIIPGPGDHQVKVAAEGYQTVDLGKATVHPDRETVRHCYFRARK